MLNFRSPPGLTAKIDLWRTEQAKPRPSRSQAIRQLLEMALAKFKP
jgi:hypothetical protein